MSIFRWEIYLANLDPVVGSEQGKTRPVLVVSHSGTNALLRVVNALPLTSPVSRTATSTQTKR